MKIVSIIFGLLCIGWFVSWSYNRNLEIALRSPSDSAIFALYGREAIRHASREGFDARERTGEVTLDVYNLTEREITDKISFVGFSPVLIFRCSMSGFTDASTEGYMMFVHLVPDPATSDIDLHIGSNSFSIASVPRSDGDFLMVPDLLKRNLPESLADPPVYSMPSQAQFRIWKADDGLTSNSPPTVTPKPIFQADWFNGGKWEGTIAFFDSSQTVSEATIQEH